MSAAALLRLAALAAMVGALFAAVALSGGLSSDRVHDALDGAGWVGPVAFVFVSAALTVALFPGPLLAGASGLLFGTALGAPTAIVAATVGACAAFLVSRHVGARAVDELSGRRVRRAAGVDRRARLPVGALRADPAADAVQPRQLRGWAHARALSRSSPAQR